MILIIIIDNTTKQKCGIYIYIILNLYKLFLLTILWYIPFYLEIIQYIVNNMIWILFKTKYEWSLICNEYMYFL